MSSLRRHIGVLGQVAGFYLIYFLFFGRHFTDGSAVLVGDSQIAISLNNLAAHTLKGTSKNSCFSRPVRI